jgi:hypothetical protein
MSENVNLTSFIVFWHGVCNGIDIVPRNIPMRNAISSLPSPWKIQSPATVEADGTLRLFHQRDTILNPSDLLSKKEFNCPAVSFAV